MVLLFGNTRGNGYPACSHQSHELRVGAVMLYALSAMAGMYLAAVRGWALLWIGLIGIFASISYTAPPFRYKYKALGELSVFIMWGPLMVEGAYFVQRQAFSMEAFWVSLPFGVLVALVLLINNTRDIGHDKQKGIITIPILICLYLARWISGH
jgi:1,4-dihydroxy-2-naphthoate octaprenyltransferase